MSGQHDTARPLLAVDDHEAYPEQRSEEARLRAYLRAVSGDTHADEARYGLYLARHDEAPILHALLAILAAVERTAAAVERLAAAVEGLQ
jgi:hypothetical protein